MTLPGSFAADFVAASSLNRETNFGCIFFFVAPLAGGEDFWLDGGKTEDETRFNRE